MWQKWPLFVRKGLTLCSGLLCEFFWTPCISVNHCDENDRFLSEKVSLYAAVYSVIFFWTSCISGNHCDGNDRFLSEKVSNFLDIMYFGEFLKHHVSEEFLCVFFYTSPCSAHEAGLRPALLAPRLEKIENVRSNS